MFKNLFSARPSRSEAKQLMRPKGATTANFKREQWVSWVPIASAKRAVSSRPKADRLRATKESVRTHWEAEVCGGRYGDDFEKVRYALETHIENFADFGSARGKRVLEIGVGAGVDFLQWIKAGAIATGVDLTQAAIARTAQRLAENNISKDSYCLAVADAEKLPFPDNSFDIVYSWGVLHHTPDTFAALKEAYRVLRPGGALKIMLYHLRSWTAFLLWLQHGLFAFRPHRSLKQVVFEFLESPGTKAFTIEEAKNLVAHSGFEKITITAKLSAGDLLTIKPSKKYQSAFWSLMFKLYPRKLVRALGDRFGLELLITANKT